MHAESFTILLSARIAGLWWLRLIIILITLAPFTYQCSSKVKPSMLMVEVSLGCMVTVVGKLIVLDQKCQIPQLALEQFWWVIGIAEGKQKNCISEQNVPLPTVHLTPNFFLPLTKSLHLFETNCAVLRLFQPNIDIFVGCKNLAIICPMTDWARKGHGSIPYLTPQTDLHCIKPL